MKNDMKNDETGISVAADGREVVLSGFWKGKGWMKRVSPAEAVSLWRCLTGETNKVQLGKCDIGCGLGLAYDDVDGLDRWKLHDGGFPLAWLHADEAMALAWGLKKCVEEAMGHAPAPAPTALALPTCLDTVWVLSLKWTYAGLVRGSVRLGSARDIYGAEKAFASKEAAEDSLRETLRLALNSVEYEDYWDDRNVDNALDDLIDDPSELDGGITEWAYNGARGSFRVTISEVPVRGRREKHDESR